MEPTKERYEQLLKAEKELNEVKEKQAKTEHDVILNEEIDKRVKAIIAELHPTPKKIEFTKAPEKPVDGVEYGKGLQDFMMMVRAQDPAIAHLKTAMSTTSAQGGYTIPTTLLDGIINEIAEQSEVWREATPIGLAEGLSVNLNSIATGITVRWSTEAGTKEETKPTFSQDSLTLAFIYALIVQTNELKLGTNLNLEAFLKTLVAQYFALEFENQIFNGIGTPVTGLGSAAGVRGGAIGAVGNPTYDDLVNIVTNVLQLNLYRKQSKFQMNTVALAKIMKLKDNDGKPLWSMNLPTQGVPSTILGYPYEIATQITTAGGNTSVYFGPMKTIFRAQHNTLGDAINVLYSDVAVVDNGAAGVTHSFFSQNKSGWRMEQCTNFIVGIPGAWVKATDF